MSNIEPGCLQWPRRIESRSFLPKFMTTLADDDVDAIVTHITSDETRAQDLRVVLKADPAEFLSLHTNLPPHLLRPFKILDPVVRAKASTLIRNRRLKYLNEKKAGEIAVNDEFTDSLKVSDLPLYQEMVARFDANLATGVAQDPEVIRTVLRDIDRRYAGMPLEEEEYEVEWENEDDITIQPQPSDRSRSVTSPLPESEVEELLERQTSHDIDLDAERSKTEFTRLAHQRFLLGRDHLADYDGIDFSEEYDDLVIVNADKENDYFDNEAPSTSTTDTGVLDY